MKKFFALFTVVALLAVAGSAFAVEIATVSDQTTVAGSGLVVALSVTPTEGVTSPVNTYTATVSGGTSGGLTYSTNTGSNLTFAANTAGTYTVTVTVTETGTYGGHASSSTATTSFGVTVTAASSYDDTGSGNAGGMSTNVSTAAVAAIANKLGTTVTSLPATVTLEESTITNNTTVDMEDGSSCVGVLPSMTGLSAGTYVVEVKFGTINSTLVSVPKLYPDAESATSVTVKFYTISDQTEIDSSNVGTLITSGSTAYMVFTVGVSGIVNTTSSEEVNAAVDMTNPVLGAEVDTNYPSGPGKSSGGCDAGFTALALAVLGGFIATRRK